MLATGRPRGAPESATVRERIEAAGLPYHAALGLADLGLE